MRKLFKLIPLSLLVLLSICAVQDSNAQTKKKEHAQRSLRDSLRKRVLQRDAMMRSFKNSDGSINNLLNKIEDYTTQYNEDITDIQRGFDTLNINQRLPTLEKRMATMGSTIDKSTTLGYLFTIRDMIDHAKSQMSGWEDQLTDDNSSLDDIHSDITTFKADTALRTAPADSSLRLQCFLQVQQLEKKWKKLDSCNKKSIIRIGSLENRVSALSILLIDLDDRIDLKINSFIIKATTNEYGFIWDMQNSSQLDTTLSRSYTLNSRLYKYFFIGTSNYYSHAATVIVLLAFLFWIVNSRRKIVKVRDNYRQIFDQTNYIVKHHYLSALIVASVLSIYFYMHPPQVFTQTMLLITMACIGVLIKDKWPKPLFDFWKTLFVLTIFFSISVLLILIPYADRWLTLLLSAVAIYASYTLIKKLKISAEGYPPYLDIILKVFIALQVISVLLNITGRFSLAKITGATATFNLCLGMGLYLFVQILMESLFLQLEANKTPEGQSIASYLDFNELQKKFKDVVIKVAGILWLVALVENLNIDDYLYDEASDFLGRQYAVGNTDYTFGSVLIFIIVIWISGLVARIISYFYDFTAQQTKLTLQAKKTRSSILLIRLTIFVIGFFVAIAAAKIPMTQVTIIVGALGVGIGFGLQNIVNNLVSGIILAFEKPVQVGDIIEVGGKTGTIKEIGIRSSRISCGDGSELIIPNGDLISQHVINWTLTNNNRQVELMVGVAYGTDVDKVDAILKKIINEREDILKTPAPEVFLHNFSESAVDFKLSFWAADIGNWVNLKSKVMSELYTQFAKEGIEIPHPKRDIQVYFPGGVTPENISKLQTSTENPPAKDQ